MPSETLLKLQPDRTIHLRGFDRRGAAAALHHASSTGFQCSGVFRDFADFAVVVLWDADNWVEHYSIRYLPDFDFTGMVLTFDLDYNDQLQPIDSVKNPWIAWDVLSAIRSDGTTATVKLWDHASLQAGSFDVASTTWTLTGTPAQYDRLTFFYRDIPFDYWITDTATHSLQQVADNIRDQINQYNWPVEAPALAIMAETGTDSITIKAARWGTVNTSGTAVTWVSGDKFTGLAAGSKIYVDGVQYTVSSVSSATSLTLSSSAGTLSGKRYLAERGGEDGNMIRVHCRAKTTTLDTSGSSAIGAFRENHKLLAGGSSNVTWRVSIDFTGLGIDSLRQCWLTLAPRLANGAAYGDTEFLAEFKDWSVSDPSSKRALKVAGPGSVRVSSRDAWASYSGSGWAEADYGEAWFFRGFARRSKTTNDKITITYSCQYTHDLYIGTALYVDRGIAGVKLDGDTETDLDCYLLAEPAVLTRRRVRVGVAAGEHTLELRVKGTKNAASSDYFIFFDYLEAARRTDAEDASTTYANVMPATDYDTDHTYKLPPQRLVWALHKLGFRGDLNHYVGVFWWAQRKRVAGHERSYDVAIGGTWAVGERLDVTLSGIGVKKTLTAIEVDGGDASVARKVLARSIVDWVNHTFSGVWAEVVSGETVRIHSRSTVFRFDKSASKTSTSGTFTESGDLELGSEGIWEIDPAATPYLNRAARDWHADLFSELKANGLTCTCAYSMELLNPPSGYAALYNDGTAVLTATGFGTEGQAAITGATNATPIEITATAHGYQTGDSVNVSGVLGNTAANGARSITRVNADKFKLNGSAGNGTYTGGGIVTRNLKTTHCSFISSVSDYQKQIYKETAGLMNTALLTPWLQFGEFVWWFFAGGSPASMAFYDAATAAAAVTALGRALHLFASPTDDPAVNSHADANFLRDQVKLHIDAIRTFVSATYSGAKYELLWPNDVNYATPSVFGVGGRLNRYVNWPSAYDAKSGSGLDRLKMEALAFGKQERNWDKAKESIEYPATAPRSWAASDTAYLVPWHDGGCPWSREYLHSVDRGLAQIAFWAWDHLCLMGWPLPLPKQPSDGRLL